MAVVTWLHEAFLSLSLTDIKTSSSPTRRDARDPSPARNRVACTKTTAEVSCSMHARSNAKPDGQDFTSEIERKPNDPPPPHVSAWQVADSKIF